MLSNAGRVVCSPLFRIGIHELTLPEAHRRDFDKLPDHICTGLTVHFAKRYQDVAEGVFG
ncbi:MAG: hypothetical protein BGP20_11415 [Thiobacillus sp. 63-78]|uniref:S16 family serine protease n=1 Tax=Thiobacillus sp. 63-78 TaxID=1895859 RepID=UPI00095B537F|nr:S16 family serine protease [Thiobacillus sp. 63-78]MBN8763907.1 hypothetical protein [Thiobacillus sp.]MBN8774777.1 hypothetical protein [Thiobacillus sp.]OJZ16668.1 MAG: hypothetical protein BGP20_11415 [Thiobacillus sp. 63-78]